MCWFSHSHYLNMVMKFLFVFPMYKEYRRDFIYMYVEIKICWTHFTEKTWNEKNLRCNDHYQQRKRPHKDQHLRRYSNYESSKISRHIERCLQQQERTSLQTITTSCLLEFKQLMGKLKWEMTSYTMLRRWLNAMKGHTDNQRQMGRWRK